MEKSKLSSFFKRLGAAVVMIPLVLGCLFGGTGSVYLLAMTIAALLSWEWSAMVPNRRPAVFSLIYFFMAVCALRIENLLIVAVVFLAAMILTFIKTKNESRRGLLMLGVPYIAIGIGSIIGIYDDYGEWLVLWYLVLIWGVDIGGYVFGCTIRGPKLAPRISPNKTWAGFFGGMFLAVAVTYAFCEWFVTGPEIRNQYLCIAVCLSILSQIGDLVESWIKRRLGIKDSSNLIPGHGGIFDRIDGLIFAAPFALVLLHNINIFPG